MICASPSLGDIVFIKETKDIFDKLCYKMVDFGIKTNYDYWSYIQCDKYEELVKQKEKDEEHFKKIDEIIEKENIEKYVELSHEGERLYEIFKKMKDID